METWMKWLCSCCLCLATFSACLLGCSRGSETPGNSAATAPTSVQEIFARYDLSNSDDFVSCRKELELKERNDPGKLSEFVRTSQPLPADQTTLAVFVVGQADSKAGQELVEELLESNDPQVRSASVLAAGKFNSPEFNEIVRKAATDPAESVRKSAYMSLRPSQSSEYVQFMKDRFDAEPSRELKEEVLFQLALVGSETAKQFVLKNLDYVSAEKRGAFQDFLEPNH